MSVIQEQDTSPLARSHRLVVLERRRPPDNNPLTIFTTPLLPSRVPPLRPTSTSETSATTSSAASSSLSVSSSSSPSTTSSTLSSTPPPSSSTPDLPTETFADPFTSVVVQTIDAPSSTSAAASRHSSTPNSFLANKPLSGAVFGIAGLLGLIILVVAITYGLRRARRDRFDSISFDPDITSDSQGRLVESGIGIENQRSQGASTSGHGHDIGPYENVAYPDYGQMQQVPMYPGTTANPQTSTYPNQQAYYNVRPQSQTWNQPSTYNVPSALAPGYDVRPDMTYQSQGPPAAPRVYPGIGAARWNDAFPSNAPGPSIVTGQGLNQTSNFSQGPVAYSSPASPPLPNPYAAIAPPTPPGKPTGHVASNSRELNQSSVPPSAPLPGRFGSETGSRESIEADAQFWGRTLKIANQ